MPLLPCPFCGDQMPELRTQFSEAGERCWIECRACGARSRTVLARRDQQAEHHARLEVRGAWNERPPDRSAVDKTVP